VVQSEKRRRKNVTTLRMPRYMDLQPVSLFYLLNGSSLKTILRDDSSKWTACTNILKHNFFCVGLYSLRIPTDIEVRIDTESSYTINFKMCKCHILIRYGFLCLIFRAS
jgi:hypothetical protein